MSFSFPYRKEYVENQSVYRPKIPIILRKYRKEVSVVAIVDSGSDFSLIPKELAEYLGLDMSGKKYKIKGVGGSVESIKTRVNVVLMKGRKKYHIPQMIVKVLLTKEKWEDVILGRIPFFKHFDITFKENSRRIILRRSKHGLITQFSS